MQAVEDEQHVLFDCPFYSIIRGQQFSLFGPNYQQRDLRVFFEQNSHQLGFVAHHIRLCFQARMSDESQLAPHPAHFASLVDLDLSMTQLGASGIQSLVTCKLPQLHWLTQQDADFSTLAAMYLSQGSWPSLERLYLLGNHLNEEADLYLTKGDWPLLKSLGLTWTNLSEAAYVAQGVVNAHQHLRLHKVQSLKVHFNALRSLTQPCLTAYCMMQYLYDPGILPSSAN